MNKRRRTWLLNQTLTAMLFFVLSIYVCFTTIQSWASSKPTKPFRPNILLPPISPNTSSSSSSSSSSSMRVKVYMYDDLPTKFTYGVVEHFWTAHGFADVAKSTIQKLKYPSHQHSLEWHLLLDLTRPENERTGSPVIRVMDPNEADLFYVPFFSSLSWVVSRTHFSNGSGQVKKYSDSETQEELVTWLEGQEYWRRNKGRDHVLVCQNPNALNRVMNRVKNALLLVSDLGRVRPDRSSLVKDVVVPDSHRISAYNGDVGVENRKTLLFFMGNRFRKGVKRYFEYKDPNGTVNKVWRQVSQKLPLIKLMISCDRRLATMHVTETDCSACLCSNQSGIATTR
ncbi:probable arabinosyltransferase ARAD1 isoform X1 [Quercus suber]|uniref:probable arabinosyltransferase ARAD1 isoform X1 n=1 Tax=Quercus suber TaxID=58331 RepID=UPI0032DE320E